MTDFDEPKDPSWLRALDWVQLNKLQRAYKDGGDDALDGACRDLMNEDMLLFARIVCAYMPCRNALKMPLKMMVLPSRIDRTGQEETTLKPRPAYIRHERGSGGASLPPPLQPDLRYGRKLD
jgi:hypothetical protein